MLTHPLRRAISACASVLLILGLIAVASSPSVADDAPTYLVKGTLSNPDRVGQAGISVHYYRATDDPDQPWLLEANQVTGSHGAYSALLPAGTYRIMFNEFDDGTAAWTTWRPTPWTRPTVEPAPTEFTLGPGPAFIHTYNTLQPREATITGKLTTSQGTPAANVYVAAHPASDPSARYVSAAQTGPDGTYSLRVPTDAVKIRVHATGRLVPRWIGTGPTVDEAKTFDLVDAETSSGNDSVVTYVPPALVTGRVHGPDGNPVVHATVRFYKSADGDAGPGVFYNQTTNTRGPGELGGHVGTFKQELEPGLYRIKISPSNADGGLLQTEFFGDAATIDTAQSVAQIGSDQDLPPISLDYSGGLISGRVVDMFNRPLANATVVSQLSSGSDGYAMATTLTDATGAYTIRGGAEPVDLRFTKDADYLQTYVLNNLTAPAGQTITASDVQMLPRPIKMTSSPSVSGTVAVGKTIRTSGGSWLPVKVTKKYQWYYLKSGKIRAISGATRSYLGLHSVDYGKRFRVRVTASHPGVTSKVVTSSWSRALLRNSSVSISGSSPSRGKVKLSAKVDASGAKATGKVRFSCATPAATFASKTVTLRTEKASATFYHLPKTKMTCRASYAGTSTIKSSSKSKTIYVK